MLPPGARSACPCGRPELGGPLARGYALARRAYIGLAKAAQTVSGPARMFLAEQAAHAASLAAGIRRRSYEDADPRRLIRAASLLEQAITLFALAGDNLAPCASGRCWETSTLREPGSATPPSTAKRGRAFGAGEALFRSIGETLIFRRRRHPLREPALGCLAELGDAEAFDAARRLFMDAFPILERGGASDVLANAHLNFGGMLIHSVSNTASDDVEMGLVQLKSALGGMKSLAMPTGRASPSIRCARVFSCGSMARPSRILQRP